MMVETVQAGFHVSGWKSDMDKQRREFVCNLSLTQTSTSFVLAFLVSMWAKAYCTSCVRGLVVKVQYFFYKKENAPWISRKASAYKWTEAWTESLTERPACRDRSPLRVKITLIKSLPHYNENRLENSISDWLRICVLFIRTSCIGFYLSK